MKKIFLMFLFLFLALPVKAAEFDMVRGVFDASGITEVVPEATMDAVVAAGGSAPAYVFKLAAAVVKTAAERGLDPETGLRLFAQTLTGSAKMLLESGHSAEALIRMVASPNGTTAAALEKMDALGFDEAVCAAVNACVDRSIELGSGV